MQKKLFHINFKVRLFLYVTIVFVIIALIVSFLFSMTSIQNTKQSEISNAEIILERAATQVESLYEQMNIAATSIIKNASLKNIIIDLNTKSSKNELMKQYETTKLIQKALTNMMFSSIISNVILYDSVHNYFYYAGLYLNDKSITEPLLKKNQYKIFQTNQETLKIYLGPHQSPWTKKENIVLSVLRNFVDNVTTQSTIVEIQVPYTHLKTICEQDTFQKEKEIILLDKNHQVVFPYNKNVSVVTLEILEKIKADMQRGEKKVYTKNYMYCSQNILDSNYYIVFISNNKSIKHYQHLNLRNTIITVSFVLTTVLIILFIIISLVTKPLKQLIQYIKKINLEQDTTLDLMNNSLDEFEIINDSFNQMFSRLKESIQQTYEAKIRESNANLMALQAQINPHFLYNALNSISAASETYGSEVTTKMCQDFSSMMRYITSQSQNKKLIEEIKHTKNYLDFMKISYDGNFNYKIQIPIELYNLILPKLTIQPLVENSFKHGFHNCLPPWEIEIISYFKDGFWFIEILDNGDGFPKEVIEEFEQFKFHYQFQNNSFVDKLQIEGMGLKNIYCRLYIYYEKNFDFTIESENRKCKIILKGHFTND